MSDAATNNPDDLQREIEAVRKRALDTTVSFRGDGVAPGSVSTSSIADDAVTNAKLANMAQYRVKGRQSSGTGDPEDVPTDDLLVLADGSSARRDLGARFGEVANVRDYGAAGDGATDDSSAIAAALAAGKKTVFFPAGTYRCGAITVPTLTRIVGEGASATIIQPIGSLTAYVPFITLAGTSQEIRDLQVSVSKATHPTTHAIGIQSATRARLSNIYIPNAGYVGIYLAASDDVLVDDCEVRSFDAWGIYAESACTNLGLHRCTVYGPGATHNIQINGGAHHVITECHSEESPLFCISVFNASHVVVSNNICVPTDVEGINVEGCTHVTVADNDIDCQSGHGDFGISVYGNPNVPNEIKHVSVSGNRVYFPGKSGIAIAGDSSFVHVTGNLIVSPNQLNEAQGAGVILYGGSDCALNVVQGNRMVDEGSTMKYGVNEWDDGTGDPDGNTVADNFAFGSGVTAQVNLLGATSIGSWRDGDHLYLLKNGVTRRTAVSTAALTTGRVALVATGGVLTDDPGIIWTSGALTASTSLRCQASGNDSIAAILGGIYFATPASSYGALGYNIQGSGSANTWEYVGGDTASWLQFQGNQINCYVAASGSAGATISPTLAWITDSSGKIAIGTDPGGSSHLRVGGQITFKETGGATLTIGAIDDGEYLKRSGTTIISDTVSGGSGNRVSAVTESAQSSAFTASTGTYYACTGTTYTITLPTAVSAAGQVIAVRTAASGTLTLDGNGSQTIGGRTTLALVTGDYIEIISDGANWVIQTFEHADWTAFTPTITATTSDPTKGTRTETCYWRRDGHDMLIAFHYEQTAAGSSGTGTYLIALPISAAVDTTIAPVGDYGSTSAIPSIAGIGLGVLGTSSAARPLSIMLYDSTRIFCRGPAETDTDQVNSWGSTYFGLGGAGGTSVVFTARVPISGW